VPFRRFQSRIIVVFMGLFFLVLAAMLFAVDRVNTQHARSQVSESLNIGGRAFVRLFDARSERLMEGVRILSSDFALRGAVATGDRGTILSALANHGARIGAGVAMLVSLDNRLLVDTLRPRAAPRTFPFPRLTEIAQLRGQASSIAFLGDSAFQLVVVPILAPDPIAWVAMGFRVDEKLAQELRTITSAHVSFLRAAPDTGEWSVVASTLPPPLREGVRRELPSTVIGRDDPFALGLADGEYETRVLPLAAEDDAPVVAVLQLSLNEALAPFAELRLLLFGLTGAGLLVSLAGSVVLARRVTQPVAVLAAGVREIEQGAYGREVALRQQDEFGALAAAFNHMSRGIAEREGRLRFLAYHDELTGLPNRAALEEHLHRRLTRDGGARGRPALLLVALDRFKDINYTLGFQVGDRVLQHVGTRLQGLAGANDMVARFGGGEFGIVLDVVQDETDARRLAHDVQRNLEAPFRIDDQPFEFGAHIGIALYPDHADSANTLIRHAEAAMNDAFRVPGGIGLYSAEFDRQSRRRLTLIGEARTALNTEQFMLYYQPKLDLKTRRIAGVESLVRWRHPEHGFISPAEFIPVIEQTALVGPFTLAVLNLGLKQAATWHAAGLPLKVSLNLSARNLTDPQLPEQLAQLLGFWKLPPAQIVLEITESALMLDPDASMKVIAQLDALGAGLSIDDYGTGYSSLSFLRRLPLDELKIDKSFVLHMNEDANDEVIVRSTVELAHNLGLKVTAEGVETKAVLDKLDTIGCDSIQGYYISKPLPADALAAWLRESPYPPAA
jgi:diguanylate cyclase (GGDEF)-like protein